MKRKELEMILQNIPPHPAPKPSIEQYTTSAKLAAEILYLAYFEGDIAQKTVVDLGCGTGIFAIGAKLLGAKKSIGVDIDSKAVQIARRFGRSLALKVNFSVSKIKDYKGHGDTVIQNPPFGSQRKGADIPFLKKALEVAPVVYSLHLSKTEKYIEKIADELNATISFKKWYQFDIRHMFNFHQKKIERFPVTLFRLVRQEKNDGK